MLRQFRRALPLLPADCRMVVAVSGGQDSLCLLSLLVECAPELGWRLEVAHLDHRLRPDSALAARRVRVLASTWKLPYHLAIAATPPASEEAARRWRYGWLGELALSLDCSLVLTAHTRSDRAETLLFNLLRGSGSDGLASLDWQRPLVGPVRLVRPLLEFTRDQTWRYCMDHQLPISIDETNFDLSFRRNRIRLELLPYLAEHFNPRTEEALARTAGVLAAEAEYLESVAATYTEQLVNQGRLNRRALKSLPLAIQRRVIRRWMAEQLGDLPGFTQVERAIACLSAPNRTRTAPLLRGQLIEVEGEWLVLKLN